MADIVVLGHEVDALKNDTHNVNVRIDKLDDACTLHAKRLYALEIWKNGNGARGAEARLQGVEHDVSVLKECLGATQTDETIERIAAVAARSVIKNARERDRTTVEKLKAAAALISPILAAAAVVIAAIIAATN